MNLFQNQHRITQHIHPRLHTQAGLIGRRQPTTLTLRRAFGVPRTLGLLQGRVTYVSDSGGVIRHIFDSQIRVGQHVSEALETVQRLTAN